MSETKRFCNCFGYKHTKDIEGLAKYVGDYKTKYEPKGGRMRGSMRKTKIICTIGSESKVEQDKHLFNNVENLFK